MIQQSVHRLVGRYRHSASVVLRAAIVLFLASSPALAEEHSDGLDDLLLIRPPPLEQPTSVKVELFLLDITRIDDAARIFDVDVFVEMSWFDPRLAVPIDQRDGESRRIARTKVWTPREAVVNDRGLVPRLPDVVEVDDEGRVLFKQRYFGSLYAKMAFRKFPFDRQMLPVDLASYDYTPEEIVYSPDSRLVFENVEPGAAGWTFEVLPAEATVFSVPGRTDFRPMIRFKVLAERRATFYLLTMFLPMSLIVVMAWTVTTLPPDVIPPRIGIATTAIFSVVAMGFTVRLGLPPIAYLTKADVYGAGCTLLVFSRLGFLVLETRLAKAGDTNRAVKIGQTANRAYVLMFAVVVVVTTLM